MALRGPGTFDSFFGDSSDGNIVITGSYVMHRDTYFHNVWMSSSAGQVPTVFTNNFRLFVASKMMFITSGTVDVSGGPGGVGTAGIAVPAGSLQAGGAGGSGSVGNGQPGFPAPTNSASFGGTGGTGGTGGGTSAGTGGVASLVQATSGSLHEMFQAITGYMFGPGGPYAVAGGGGGGAGGGAGAVQVGGGGGAAGGTLLSGIREIISYFQPGSAIMVPAGSFAWGVGQANGILVNQSTTGSIISLVLPGTASFSLQVTGTFQSNGGNGGNGQAGGVTGGGGGGGGGTVINVSGKTTGSLVFQALGGTGGGSNGGGAVGVVGITGSIFNLTA